MTKILIADDDLHLRKLVRTYAEVEGYQCDEVESGTQVLEKIDAAHYDLIILDVMMPGLDGFQVLGEIRKTSSVPVIMLTARNEEYDTLLGFNLGADDYLAKPFSPRELMARMKAVLKRTQKNADETLVFGELVIAPKGRTVTLGGERIALPPKEFDLLLYLVQNEHIVLSREQLLEKVWGFDYYGEARTIDTHVKSLREHLGTYRKHIHTIWGVGYKFEYLND